MTKKDLLQVITNAYQIVPKLNLSFSQEGEDIALDRLMNYKERGFYVDIGAHHPIRFSNTYKFYLKGWHGLNIDAMPNSMTLFKKYRPKDINVEAGISDSNGELKFYIFKEKALNTFDSEIASVYIANGYQLEKTEIIKTYNVNDILNKYLKENQEIDFMDIDIEGLDEMVVQALDWERFAPRFVLVENLSATSVIDEVHAYDCLEKYGYRIVAKTGLTCFYTRNE